MVEIGGDLEEEVFVGAYAGDDRHGDLDVAALVGGGEDVEGGEGEAEESAEGGAYG